MTISIHEAGPLAGNGRPRRSPRGAGPQHAGAARVQRQRTRRLDARCGAAADGRALRPRRSSSPAASMRWPAIRCRASALSNVALCDAVMAMVDAAPRAVILGGGGYNPWTLARAWTGLWGRLSRGYHSAAAARGATCSHASIATSSMPKIEIRNG